MGAGIVIAYVGFILALPICSFILSLWYGYKLTSVFKWLIVIACACPGIVLVAIMSKDFKDWDYGYVRGIILRNHFRKTISQPFF